jgi:MFS family permease
MAFEHHQQGETTASTAKPAVSYVSRGTIFLLATGCGIIAGGSYFVQSLVTVIGYETGLSRIATGLIVTESQLGDVLGLLFAAPLGDLTENRQLLLLTLAASSAFPIKLTRWRVKCLNSKAGFHAAI